MRLLAPFTCAALVGCAAGPAPVHEGACGAGPVDVAVVREITFARAVDGVSEGFDLDGVVSSSSDPGICGTGDWVAPDGTPGIDNAMAGVLPLLEATEAQALEPLIQDQINSGTILLLLELSDLDDTADDPCVGFRLLRGAGLPMVGNDARIQANQTLEVDWSQSPRKPTEGTAEDGVVLASDFVFELPVEVFDFHLTLQVPDARIRIEPHADGSYTGVLAGGFLWEPLVAELQQTNIDKALAEALPALIGGVADLDPDAEGQCQQVSVVLEFEAANAYVY